MIWRRSSELPSPDISRRERFYGVIRVFERGIRIIIGNNGKVEFTE